MPSRVIIRVMLVHCNTLWRTLSVQIVPGIFSWVTMPWNQLTSSRMKQLTLLRIGHSRDWCLHLALQWCMPEMNKWIQGRLFRFSYPSVWRLSTASAEAIHSSNGPVCTLCWPILLLLREACWTLEAYWKLDCFMCACTRAYKVVLRSSLHTVQLSIFAWHNWPLSLWRTRMGPHQNQVNRCNCAVTGLTEYFNISVLNIDNFMLIDCISWIVSLAYSIFCVCWTAAQLCACSFCTFFPGFFEADKFSPESQLMSTSESWEVNWHTTRCTGFVSMVLQLWLRLAECYRKRRSMLPYGPMRLGKDFTLHYHILLFIRTYLACEVQTSIEEILCTERMLRALLCYITTGYAELDLQLGWIWCYFCHFYWEMYILMYHCVKAAKMCARCN